MTILWKIALAAAFALIAYAAHATWQEVCHARRARRLGCKPAFVRPCRLPFGLDTYKRYIDANKSHNAQNDDVATYEELGCRPTWYQQVLGNWHYVTSDPKVIQAMLATQFKDFELGPLRRGGFGPFLGDGIFTADGKQWEHDRALLRPQFTRTQISNLEVEESHVQALFERIPSAQGQWTDKVDLRPLFFHLTLDSATEFLFGESVHSQQGQDRAKNTAKTTSDAGKPDWAAFGEHFDAANLGVLYRFRLFDLYFLYNPKSFRDNCREVHRCVDYFVKLALSDEKADSKDNRYVFLNELAKVTQDPLVLRTQLLNILLAGRDTTAGLLGWVFYFLARHPDIYQRLRQNILHDFSTGTEDINFESLKACTLLQHVISETLRLEAIVPENFRQASNDVALPCGGGEDGKSPIYVRKGQMVSYLPRVMHRRKDIWGDDADDFKPERWQGRKTGWEYLPFNGGPRVCLGQQFALTEAGYVIVRILQRFDRLENLDDKVETRHWFTQTTAPLDVTVRFHRAADG